MLLELFSQLRTNTSKFGVCGRGRGHFLHFSRPKRRLRPPTPGATVDTGRTGGQTVADASLFEALFRIDSLPKAGALQKGD